MTKPNDDLISEYAALQHLRETEQRLGIEPLQRAEDCPQPSDLMQTILGEARAELAARVENHAVECVYCARALQSLKAELADETLPELPNDVEDSVARWVVSKEPLRRKPSTVPQATTDASTRQETTVPRGNKQTAAQEKKRAGWPVDAALGRSRAHSSFALPQLSVRLDSGPVRDDGYVTYDFDDPNLKAAVSREDDDRYLLHVEHHGCKPGDLILAVVKSPDESEIVWQRWLVLRLDYQNRPSATAWIDKADQIGDHHQLFLDAVAVLPPGSAEQVRESFLAAQRDDAEAVPSWQTWARAVLAAGVSDDALRLVLEEIRGAGKRDSV